MICSNCDFHDLETLECCFADSPFYGQQVGAVEDGCFEVDDGVTP